MSPLEMAGIKSVPKDRGISTITGYTDGMKKIMCFGVVVMAAVLVVAVAAHVLA